MRTISVFLQLIGLFVLATLGYWVWFVNWGPNPNDRVGVTVATLVPMSVKDWGCGRLSARFAAETPAICSVSSLPAQPNSAPSDGSTPGGGRL
ncbi:hypothetical protein IHQ68_00280 [Chelatococcus sambhunathii]|uniref:Uncharacterized protein n=1 Tax=Chelatococcus sambhunathii TaxID=363953 RepID=A0ABU1DAC3_9HYPH|nr:hypothetical protein [Chelatococcus sambhunathii]MDR4305063.1 hypothetical protein [Chelatococcus sambhunathii]